MTLYTNTDNIQSVAGTTRHHRRSRTASDKTNFYELKPPLSLQVSKENTPYSSTEPNESVIVNRQSGGEKLKHVQNFT